MAELLQRVLHHLGIPGVELRRRDLGFQCRDLRLQLLDGRRNQIQLALELVRQLDLLVGLLRLGGLTLAALVFCLGITTVLFLTLTLDFPRSKCTSLA